MATFRISAPEFENDKLKNIDSLIHSLKDSQVFDDLRGLIDINENDCTAILAIGDDVNLYAILGKKYIRIMDNTLQPKEVSQINYESDLDFDKYKTKIGTLVESHKELISWEKNISESIQYLTDEQLKNIDAKHGVKLQLIKLDPESNYKSLQIQMYYSDGTVFCKVTLVASKSGMNIDVEHQYSKRFSFHRNVLHHDGAKMTSINASYSSMMAKVGEVINEILKTQIFI